MSNPVITKPQLEQMIKDITGYPVSPLIRKQINRFVLENDMSFLDIARCIVWYDEQYHGKFDPLYGISFVPNIFPQAAEYFRQLALEQQRKKEEAHKVVEYQENNIIFNIKSLEHKKRVPKHLDISEIDVKGEDHD